MEAFKEPNSENIEHLMTSDEVADILHVDPVTIRRLINKSELSAYRIGSDYRIAPTDLKDYLLRQRIPANSESATGPMMGNDPLSQFVKWLQTTLSKTPSTVFKQGQERHRFDRFTERARRVLTYAQEEAQRFQHNYIGTEHLLLALIREGEGIGGRVLKNMGVELDKARGALESIIGRGDRIVFGEINLTPRSKKVIELAVDEARRMRHHFIGTEHILLGLIREGEGIAAGMLESLGVNLEQVRKETLRLIKPGAPKPQVPAEAAHLLAEGQERLVCNFCGANCPTYFTYCFNCGQNLTGEDDE